MSHELCKLNMIDSDVSVHVCSLKNGQGNGFRKSSKNETIARNRNATARNETGELRQ